VKVRSFPLPSQIVGLLRITSFLYAGAAFVEQALALDDMQYSLKPDSEDVMTCYGVVTTGKYGVVSAAHDVLKIAPGQKGFVSNFAFEISKHRCWERETVGLASMVAF